jgi:hypothetical protein
MMSIKSENELKQRYAEIFDKTLKEKRIRAFWNSLEVNEVIV